MMAGRPRTDIGTFGKIQTTSVSSGGYRASTRIRDDDGKLRRVQATGQTKSAATLELKRRLRDRENVGETGGKVTADSSFADLANLWIANIRANSELSNGTKETYEAATRTVLLPTWGEFSVREMTPARIENFVQAQRAKSYSRARRAKTMLRLILAFAVRQGALERNPVESASQLRRPKSPPKALTFEEIARIRSAAREWRSEGGPGPKSDRQVADIIEVMLGTACRIGEVLALRRCDVDMETLPPTIAVTGTVVTHKGMGTYRQTRPKTDDSYRIIAIPVFTAETVRRRLTATAGMDPDHLLFFSRNGTPLTPNNVRRTFREMLAIAGLEDREIRPHSFRKTGATLINELAGEQAASDALGHTSVATTRAHYIERSKVANPAIAKALESLAPKQTE